MVMGPGENAGAVSVGDGWAVAFKVESHNHPSAVEPFQGAATGVGGILRDVFALGARPIAMLDSLRFGELDSERSRYLFEHVVAGIGHYGNSIGVPTVGGEVYFEAPYEQNCLVNAMCVGLARADRMVRAAAAGRRQRRRADGRLDRARRDRRRLGARLGRARGRRRSKRPTVQIGDPFEEAKLIECCLELLGAGPAGLASGPRRRRAHVLGGRDGLGGRGRDRHRRRPGAAARGRHGAVRDHGLRVAGADAGGGRAGEGRRGARHLREVGDGRRRGRRGDRRRATSGSCAAARSVGEMPVAALVDDCPLYDLEPRRARRVDLRERDTLRPIARCASATGRPGGDAERRSLLALLASPSIASKRWAFEQYDSIVGSRTVRRPERGRRRGPAAAEAGATIAVSIDGNGRRVACDPYAGTIEAVLECAQNLACAGAEPLGLTNCLNFGNPEKPAVAWQLDRSTQGLADACEALGVPVVGGNVSLYNETEDGPIYPTPVVGMVGELPDPERRRGRRAARRRRDRAGRPVRAVARRLRAGEAARRARAGPAAACRSTTVAAAIDAVREAVRGGPCRRGPRRQRRRARLRAGRDGDRRRRRRRGRPRRAGRGARLLAARRRCSARARAASWSPARAPSSSGCVRRRRPADRRSAGGDRISIAAAEAEADVPLADAERAWRSLGERLEVAYAGVTETATRADRACVVC